MFSQEAEWREVRMPGKPVLDRRHLVRAIVIHHQMDIKRLGHVGIDRAEETPWRGSVGEAPALRNHHTVCCAGHEHWQSHLFVDEQRIGGELERSRCGRRIQRLS